MNNEEALKKLINIYSELETKLLDEIVGHFNFNEEFINSDYWRAEKLEELGLLNENILNYIAEVTDKTPNEIKEALNQIGYNTLNINNLNKAYKGGFLKIDPSILIQNQVVQNLIQYSYNETSNRFLEISKKIERATREAYLNVVERAYLQTTSGVTYQEAIRDSLIELGNKGITTLTYKTVDEQGNVVGLRNYDVEGTVRRELVTATHNLTNKINKSVAEELEIEYLYLSEHVRCRPQHFPWQGTIIKRRDLVRVTRYGEVDGLGGPNCHHYPTPYFGTARGKELKQISLEEATEQYNLSQHQRYLERGIRRWKRKERIFKNAEDKEYYKKCKEKVREWQLRNKEFTENNNLRRDFSRENVERVTKVNKNDIMKASYIRKNAYTTSKNVDSQIKLAFKNLPDKFKKLGESVNYKIIANGNSYYSVDDNTIYLLKDANKYEVLHEIGHIIEVKEDIYNDTKFQNVLIDGIENVDLFDEQTIGAINGYDKDKYEFLKIGDKFVSDYQRRIYNEDMYKKPRIDYSTYSFNYNVMRDYFSEGFRCYFEDKKLLKRKDKKLYDYVEEMLNE